MIDNLPTVTLDSAVRAAMLTMNQDGRGIALIMGAHGELLGTITDGDIRRAVLAGISLDAPVNDLLPGKPFPVTAPCGMSRADLLALMHRRCVRQIPLLDASGRVVDLATMDEAPRPVEAVVMAGGYGMRLRPLTETTPKPMLPVDGKPLLERTLERLRDAGIRRVTLTTHHLSDVIETYFGDGTDLGMQLSYVRESCPLGTAGALAKVDAPGPLLVMNGDLMTDCDFRALLAYHQDQAADLTVGVLRYELKIPYGVLRVLGSRVTALEEKPTVALHFNAGVYVVSSDARALVPSGERFDMTQLMALLLDKGRRIAAFVLIERWLDVGTPETYEAAREEGGGS